MKNRLKFRAWDGNSMWHHEDIYFVFGKNGYWEAYIYGGDDVPVISSQDENSVLMQFSGLQDKNGKDIYEGDIISLKNNVGNHIIGICEYGIARRTIGEHEVDIPCFYFRVPDYNNKKTFPITNNYLGKHDLELFEIVGNIYENIDLVKNQL